MYINIYARIIIKEKEAINLRGENEKDLGKGVRGRKGEGVNELCFS